MSPVAAAMNPVRAVSTLTNWVNGRQRRDSSLASPSPFGRQTVRSWWPFCVLAGSSGLGAAPVTAGAVRVSANGAHSLDRHSIGRV